MSKTASVLIIVIALLFSINLSHANNLDSLFIQTQQEIDKARAEGNELREAFIYISRAVTLSNYNAPDSIVLAELEHALEFARKTSGADPFYFQAAAEIIKFYLYNGDYEKSLQLADTFYNDAKEKQDEAGGALILECMGIAYVELEMYEKAEKAFHEVISTADNRLDLTNSKNASYKYLVDILINMERYDDALEMCKEYEAFLTERSNSKYTMGEEFWFSNALSYASVYIAKKQYTLAEKYISQAAANEIASLNLAVSMLESVRFELMLEQGKYTEAELALIRDEKSYEGEVPALTEIAFARNRILLYTRWEKYEKAVEAYEEYVVRSDSLQKIEMANALHSIRTQYEVDKLEMQKEQQKRTFLTTLIWFSLALVLLCIIIAIVMLNARKLHAKNRFLLEQIKSKDKLEEENERIRTELAHQNTPAVGEGKDVDQPDELYFKLKEIMKDPAVFTAPDVSRKTIAALLGTNEKYVFDLIHKYYDMNISDYITALRLNYARSLLALPSEKRTIEAIALDTGFNSRVTFHRLFKEHYGMTPVEFRKLVTAS